MQENSTFKTATMWSQPNCAWCDRAEKLLVNRGYVVTIKKIGANTTKEEFIAANPHARTVPQIYIGDTLIGGFEQVQGYLNDNP